MSGLDSSHMTQAQRNPLEPRPIDRPTAVPREAGAVLDALDEAKILAAPDSPADWPRWREQLRAWRVAAWQRSAVSASAVDTTSTVYGQPTSRWSQGCRSVALVWLWDELLYDTVTGAFTPQRLLAEHDVFGGLDAIVLWHAYPVIGLDERNQWDWYRDVPGLLELVQALQGAGLHVFVDYNPWDVGTRRARADAVELPALVAEFGADGVFLDTLREGDPALVAALGRLDPPPVLEGESRLPLSRIAEHALSWAQWFADSRYPGVLAARWFERRHMVHATRRWNRDHSEELQSAWVNGTGILIWESVFGVWVGWNARDTATLRSMRRVQQTFHVHLSDGVWTPLADTAPAAAEAGVVGSRFDLPGSNLWTIVNRREGAYSGEVLCVPIAGDVADRWYDLVHGIELRPRIVGTSVVVELGVAGRGVAGLLRVVGRDAPGGVAELLAAARADPGSTDANFRPRSAVRMASAPAPGPAPGGSIAVSAGRRDLPLAYRRRETGSYGGAPYVEEWKPLPPRLHDQRAEIRRVELTAVAVDRAEVTNGDYAIFVAASGYRPAPHNRFLRHWDERGPVAGTEHEAVTYVDLHDARAYARWRGARLPSEDEWQVAAGDSRFQRREPLVWNWTESEHTDGRTRFAMLKGGCNYVAKGSDWYFDGGQQPPEVTAKLLLAGGGLARSPSVGFRCAVDRLDVHDAEDDGTVS